MLFSPSCKKFNSLQKNKIIRSLVGGKVDGQILFGSSEKRTNLFGVKWQLRKNVCGSQRVNNGSADERLGAVSVTELDFRGLCNFCKFFAEIPYSRELQWSSRDPTMQHETGLARSAGTSGWICLNARIWRLHERQTALTWASIDKSE